MVWLVPDVLPGVLLFGLDVRGELRLVRTTTIQGELRMVGIGLRARKGSSVQGAFFPIHDGHENCCRHVPGKTQNVMRRSARLSRRQLIHRRQWRRRRAHVQAP